MGCNEQKCWSPDLHHDYARHRLVPQRHGSAQLCPEFGMKLELHDFEKISKISDKCKWDMICNIRGDDHFYTIFLILLKKH